MLTWTWDLVEYELNMIALIQLDKKIDLRHLGLEERSELPHRRV